MRTHAMGEMTVKEIREYLKTNKTIIVPYGVVEQHGYHLPVSMDIHNAEVPAYALAEKLAGGKTKIQTAQNALLYK